MTTNAASRPNAPSRQEDTGVLHFGASMALPADRTAEQARLMEELGFEYMGAGEHFMRGRPPGATHAALPLLAVAAGATERIRLVTSVALVPFYHPLLLARMTATLDIASGGRLTLGVGVGGEFPMEYEKRRHRHPSPGQPYRRMPGRAAPPVDAGWGVPAGPSLHAGRGGDQPQTHAAAPPAGVGGGSPRRRHAPGGAVRRWLAALLLQSRNAIATA